MKYINLHPFYDFCGQIGGRASRSTTLSKSAIHTFASITCTAQKYEFRIMNCSCGVVERDARLPNIINYEFRIMNCLCGVVERDARPPIGSCDLAQKKVTILLCNIITPLFFLFVSRDDWSVTFRPYFPQILCLSGSSIFNYSIKSYDFAVNSPISIYHNLNLVGAGRWLILLVFRLFYTFALWKALLFLAVGGRQTFEFCLEDGVLLD